MKKSIHVKEKLHKQLKIYAAENETSIEDITSNLIIKFLDEQKK